MSDNLVGVAEAVKRAREIAAKMLPAAGIAYNGGGDDAASRKRHLDEGDGGPQLKKSSMENSASAQAIAQAALAKVGAQFGFNQMISEEIKIPNRLVGLVIGRQGEMINKLQAESSARIQVAPDGSEVNGLRSVTICGTPETVEKAKVLVNGVIEDAGGATNMPTAVEPGQAMVEVMIPASKVGLVIGKGGEMIKTLQESAGCKMQMIQDGNFANAPEKPLRITGSTISVKKARELVLQLIEQKDMEARGHGMPQTTQVEVPRALVGFVIGRNGEHINNIQNTCGVRLQFQNDAPGTDIRVATISGNPEACSRAHKMVMDIVAEVSHKGGGAGRGDGGYNMHSMGGGGVIGGGGVGGGGDGFKPHIELPNPTGPGVSTVQFPIPAQKCGLIIGKGGDTIRQLQVQSGAHIELHRGAHPDPNEKLFNIRGNPQEIAHAQQLLTERIEGGPGYSGQPAQGYAGNIFNPQVPYGQYPYQVYGGAAAQPQQQQPPPQQQQQAVADPAAHQAAWAAYYQQLYAAQAQAGQQGGATGAPTGGAPTGAPAGATPAQPGDLQAQWAEYYRALGYTGGYYGPQQGQQPGAPAQPMGQPAATSANEDQK